MNLRILALASVVVGLAGCTVSEPRATSAVEAMGFSDVKLGGPSLFGCSDKDTFTRTFTATAANGKRVHGVICKGLMKGATVRLT